MGDTASAVQYLRAALRFAPKAAQHGAWQQKLTQHQAMIRRAQANASRRPVVHAALDQSIAVRPRLVAGREVR
jgi:F0F1-type ATP synthase delta subunit